LAEIRLCRQSATCLVFCRVSILIFHRQLTSLT
jgi:hypothetical protein